MKTAKIDYYLPPERIASKPIEQRDGSRLLVLNRDGTRKHRTFCDLPDYLNPGDMLVLNNSKVFPARLIGYKPTGGRFELLLVKEISQGLWRILTREKYTGSLRISDDLTVYISEGKTAQFEHYQDVMSLLWNSGQMPLPPYIKRQPDEIDMERYQTVYAEQEGSIAAPTAGLHFTKELLDKLTARSVAIRSITLHVGIGTFFPVKTADVENHKMEEESFEISSDLIADIERFKQSGGRVVAVGTTTTRALEGYFSGRCTIFSENSILKGSTDIFIYEGYSFRVVDSLITNFHLPCSTPLLLTASLAGHAKLEQAYKSAITRGYRFYSYGDAMLVL